jgi:hypothetical protein
MPFFHRREGTSCVGSNAVVETEGFALKWSAQPVRVDRQDKASRVATETCIVMFMPMLSWMCR